MKKIGLITLLIVLFVTVANSQKLTQTVRGTIIDNDSKMPLVGATVAIVGTDPVIGTSTDENGAFRFGNIPIGRITLQLSYLGYEGKTLPDIEVNSGKEVVLNLGMQESVVKLEEVVVRVNKNKGEALNDMSLISARSISLTETKRYAGGMDDPSRILSSFAGVTSSQNAENDIVVRGNSPKYIQWRLEGVEITNPTHFGDQNSIKGGVSALNNKLLATSDFYTGAFSPEYGDVLSGVYDIKLRAGNNEKFEAAAGVGIVGTDFTIEGPFKKGYAGSYLVNYRYSTVGMVNDIGLVDVDGKMTFQDATFKLVLPTKNIGTFSVFGLGGLSSFSLQNVKPDGQAIPGNKIILANVSKDYNKKYQLLNTGLNHMLTINNSSFITTTLSYSNNGNNEDVFAKKTIKILDNNGEYLNDSVTSNMLDYKNRLIKSTYKGSITYSNKINSKNKIQIGAKYALHHYDNNQSIFQNEATGMFPLIDFNENVSTVNSFISWKHMFNEKITLVSGIHNMNVLLNNKSSIEPRIAINWKLNNTNSIHAGYGKHSNIESIHNYFAQIKQPDGTVVEPNKDLDLLKANHYVVGYEKRFTKNLMAKVEVYYQDLYNLPVENNDTSFYATINEGTDFRYVALVNKGTGKNYGIEVTLERFFENNYYYFINGSLYNSKYKSLEGKERNTQYNGNYLFNILFGKEFEHLGKKQNQTLSLNAKVFFGGGQKYIPLLRDAQGNVAVDAANNKYWDYEKAYENKLDNFFQINLSVSYKFNKPRATHEIFLDLFNLTDNRGRMFEYYDESKPSKVDYVTQFMLFPNLMYRVYF